MRQNEVENYFEGRSQIALVMERTMAAECSGDTENRTETSTPKGGSAKSKPAIAFILIKREMTSIIYKISRTDSMSSRETWGRFTPPPPPVPCI